MNDIIKQARAEIEHEVYRGKVEAEKRRLRNKRPWWNTLFPFIVTITRRK